MHFHLLHYLRVASHFWPWERVFWLALFHDSIEDGWMSASALRGVFGLRFSAAVLSLSRNRPADIGYAEYIDRIREVGGDVLRVKRVDLAENYARAPASLRKRYAKAMAVLAA